MRWFEYHCNESHDSGDAQLWYRSHRRVRVIGIKERGQGKDCIERAENGCPRVYRVRFLHDGFEGDVFEDELLLTKSEFERPNPPQPRV